MAPKTWLITGSSSGLGLSLTMLLLKHKQHVIATSRNPDSVPKLVSQVQSLGGHWLPLDVTAPEAEITSTITKATAIFGSIDVLVNCAGYALLGAFESISEDEARAQMETNYFGPLKTTRAVLPRMRARGHGTVVQISSTAGIEARASRSAYSASKFALEGMSEALSNEVRPLGIRVVLVELGAFRTPFSRRCVLPRAVLPGGYEGTELGKMMDVVLKGYAGGQALGDVEKAGEIIFEVVMGEGRGEGMDRLRLPLGKDSAARWKVVIDELKGTLDGTEALWSSTDHED
ncbi:putative short chain oxidoreductase/dehydrogenase [Amylocarpus encephaloides]|uniref:Short chain oxidoreductase/dehydrogenase n=1 Tax=Amylocarpus encephaloides TaxID=45428 RepID=A0A9P7YSS9_9HELO|nr:putative short chain oxidoreductase/dehydrogenase [Amylocarpus encephaloides]